jgi:hypothetical protein
MLGGTEQTTWFLTPFMAKIFLVVWAAAVILYGFFRSLGNAEQDPIRKSGPLVE